MPRTIPSALCDPSLFAERTGRANGALVIAVTQHNLTVLVMAYVCTLWALHVNRLSVPMLSSSTDMAILFCRKKVSVAQSTADRQEAECNRLKDVGQHLERQLQKAHASLSVAQAACR